MFQDIHAQYRDISLQESRNTFYFSWSFGPFKQKSGACVVRETARRVSHISYHTRPFLLPSFLFLPSLSSFSSRPFIIRVAPPSLPVSALFNLAPGDSKEDQVWSWQCQAELFVSLHYVLHCTRHIFVSIWYYGIHSCFFIIPVWESNHLKHSGYHIHCSFSITYILRTQIILSTYFVRFGRETATVSLNADSVFLNVKQWFFILFRWYCVHSNPKFGCYATLL